ncbi:MAG: ABC transporter ATP-binding protein [Acidobacteriota bacterium]
MPLTVNTLSKLYGNNWVLKDASFEAVEGEILGIFGPTGSGKSTALKIVSGHEASNGGSIFWQDREITKLSSAERKFSTYAISEGTGLRSFLGLSKPAGSNADAVKKAIENSANVLLLDDAFCGFDTILRKATIEKLRLAVKEKHLTVLFATADYDQIFEACDRVAVLVNQDIRQQGTPQEVYDRPNCVPVAEIVGRNNIFISRRLTSSKSDHPEFMTLDGEHRLFAERAAIKTLGAINKNVRLAIRPENISISFGASFPEDNLLKAVVTDVRPRGASTLVELDSSGLKLEAMVVRLVGLNIGEECMIGLPPDRIQVLPD